LLWGIGGPFTAIVVWSFSIPWAHLLGVSPRRLNKEIAEAQYTA
jgi:hypothetical protein